MSDGRIERGAICRMSQAVVFRYCTMENISSTFPQCKRIGTPHQTQFSLNPQESSPELDLDAFIRFCREQARDKQPHLVTGLSLATVRISHLHCGLK